ncbi:sugar phosphate nucleotidyltransferase [Neobacillus pocheonensis]|uniref:sugar phosphate nucleotidyltransferase n=1 Tax=Neobacillus pocheonensis TaxID=363869 RepID=UPI003D264E7D
MKGVILCAGKGTRMQPFSSSLPKTLMPVANQPLLYHCIMKMKKAGICEIGIVLNHGQKEIINYLSTFPKEFKFEYIYQTEPLGIAHALSQAETFIHNDTFILMLGDNIIIEPIETLIQAFTGNKGAVLVTEVKNGSDFGIAEIKNHKVISLEEKPKHPKSNLAVIGMYAFDGSIFEAIRHIPPSKRGEYEITDAIQWMIDQGYPISYSLTNEHFSDVGTIERWLAANEWVLSKQLGDKVQVGFNTILENCTLKGPVLIGNNCIIKNTKIGPFTSIQDDSTLINCVVENSILLKNSKIMDVSPPLSNSIFGIHTTLKGINDEFENLQFILGSFSQITYTSNLNEEGET